MAAADELDVLLTTVASDSHTWNLIYLQLALEDRGHRVTNLGPCVPDDLLVGECLARLPDLVVISTVNGHGCHDGGRVVARLRSHPELASTPVVIGGKLDVSGSEGARRVDTLLTAGFDAVFTDRGGMDPFWFFVDAVRAGVAC